MNESKVRYKFRLRDVIIGVALIGVIATVSLMLLQSFREGQRRTECDYRIQQIAAACQAYHDVYQRLPPGTLGIEGSFTYEEWTHQESPQYWARAQQTSALASVCKFTETAQLYPAWSPVATDNNHFLDERGVGNFLQLAGSPEMSKSEMIMAIGVCPSDDINEISVDTILTSQPLYAPIEKSEDFLDRFGVIYESHFRSMGFGVGHQFVKTNYLANAGAHSAGPLNSPKHILYLGPMTAREQVTFDDIEDGTGNTVLFGENIGAIENRLRSSASSWLYGGLARGRGDVPFMSAPDWQTGTLLGDARNSPKLGFGSMHPKGVNLVMADGSTKTLSRKIDWQVFYEMCGMADGK